MFRKLRFNRSRYPTALLAVQIDADSRFEIGIAGYVLRPLDETGEYRT
jgi:hypothetical protein